MHAQHLDSLASDSFNAVTFIDGLTKRLVRDQLEHAANREAGFQAAPILALLSTTLADLQRLRDESDERIETLERESAQLESEQKLNMNSQTLNLGARMQEFQVLEARVATVSSTAVQIGERLEASELQLSRARGAREAVALFSQLNRGEDFPLEKEHYAEAAASIKRLGLVASELALLPRVQRAKTKVESLSELIEKVLLDEFDEARQNRNVHQMKHFAFALYDFNGGECCVRQYIAKMNFFFDEVFLQKDTELSEEIARRLDLPYLIDGEVCRVAAMSIAEMPDESSDEGLNDLQFKGFFDQVFQSCEQEYSVISRVFPNPSAVMNVLLQRIFEQRIRSFLDGILANPELTVLHRLKLLTTAFNQSSELIELFSTIENFDSMDINYDVLLSALFSQHKDNYISMETVWLSEWYATKLAAMPHLVNTTPKAENWRMRIAAGIAKKSSSDEPVYIVFPSIELVLSFLHANERSLSRCQKLSREEELGPNTYRLFSTLLKSLGEGYLIPTVDRAFRSLPSPSSLKSGFPPSLDFLEVVQQTNHIALLIQKHFHQQISPRIATFVNDHTHCMMEKNTLLALVEAKLTEGLEQLLDRMELKVCEYLSLLMRTVVIAYVREVLSTEQKKSDYKVKEDDEFDPNPSKACVAVLQFVRGSLAKLLDTLDGKNVTFVLEELGLKLLAVLVTHVKKFKISKGMGGVKLMRDLTEYRELATLFRIPAVNEQFSILREVANIFLVPPENLRALLTESLLSKWEVADVLAFVKRRTDYKSTWHGTLV